MYDNNLRRSQLTAAVSILKNEPVLASLAFNEFTGEIEVNSLPWRSNELTGTTDVEHPLVWNKEDYTHLYNWMGHTINKDNLKVALYLVACDHSYHPIKEFLSGLPEWDGVPRLDTLLVDLLGAEDTPYVRAVTRKTFVAAIRRSNNPGCKFDYTLTLVGPDEALLCLFPERYMGNITFKEACDFSAGKRIQGKWVVHLEPPGKLPITFISTQTDDFLDKRRPSRHPRECIFITRVHQESQIPFNRRYWGVEVKGWTGKEVDVAQVWAEAKVREAAGEPIYFPEGEPPRMGRGYHNQ